jgi:hypothetical protein
MGSTAAGTVGGLVVTVAAETGSRATRVFRGVAMLRHRQQHQLLHQRQRLVLVRPHNRTVGL